MKNSVIFMDNRFGYQKGGCSTFNYELYLALRQIIMTDAECRHVLSAVCSRLAVSEELCQDQMIWVWHDIFTGEYAIRMADYGGGRSVVCIHTDYNTKIMYCIRLFCVYCWKLMFEIVNHKPSIIDGLFRYKRN